MRSRRAKTERPSPVLASPDPGALQEGPSLFSMVRIVAVAVALIILLSFAAGYGFGRLFL